MIMLIAALIGTIFTYSYFYSVPQGVALEQSVALQIVPHLPLQFELKFYDGENKDEHFLQRPVAGAIGIGSIIGFVVFLNPFEQPKDVKQFYTIVATDKYDENGMQLFTLEETIKFTAIPSFSYAKKDLKVISDTNSLVLLKTSDGQQVTIDKLNHRVTVTDGDGDVRSLATNPNDYQTYMYTLLAR